MITAPASVAITTPEAVGVVNVTAQIRTALQGTPIRRGIVVVTVPHTTCGLCVNEDEAGLKDDLKRLGAHLLDPLERHGPFHHDRIDDNARAHLTSVLIGPSAILQVDEGDLKLGTWQSLFLLELDGPRTRRIEMIFIGE